MFKLKWINQILIKVCILVSSISCNFGASFILWQVIKYFSIEHNFFLTQIQRKTCRKIELGLHFFLTRHSTYNTIHMNILLAFNLFKILIYLHSFMCVCMLRSIFYVKIPLKIMFIKKTLYTYWLKTIFSSTKATFYIDK